MHNLPDGGCVLPSPTSLLAAVGVESGRSVSTMPLSNEVLPAVLAPKVIAARHQVHELIDLVAEVSAEVRLRRCAIGERNAGQIMGAGNLMAEIEGAHRVLVH
uniref:Uncharacterized protein n=1 Tax=Aegilops tauschii subsp. strangulata TaxID=200361 RepID=A0A453DRB7_AEGTS